MLKFIATIFLLFGCFTLGLALYYGKKIGIIKVFNEVKDLEQKDEFKENLPDEYGYEDEIYEDVSSEDLRNARMDESENLSKRKALPPVNKKKNEEEAKNKRNQVSITNVKNTAKNFNDETSFMDAATSFMDDQNNQNSMKVGNESTSFMKEPIEEETSFMQIPNNDEEDIEETEFINDDSETEFMSNASPSAQNEKSTQIDVEDEETSFMDLKITIHNVESSDFSDDVETSFI